MSFHVRGDPRVLRDGTPPEAGMGAPSHPHVLAVTFADAEGRRAAGRRVTLALNALSRIDVAADGTRVVGIAGCCWLTMHHDLRDVVLEAGVTWVIDRRHSPVVLTGLAVADTVVVVLPPAASGD